MCDFESIVVKVVLVMHGFVKILLFFVFLFDFLGKVIFMLFGCGGKVEEKVLEDEIYYFVIEVENVGVFEFGEKEMIVGVMWFGDWLVGVVMMLCMEVDEIDFSDDLVVI